jgi:hypothetical protein
MQPELGANHPAFGGADEPLVRDRHGVQRAVQFALPEIEEAEQLGELRRQIVLLPDKGLQQIRMIRIPIEDMGRGQAIAPELLLERE